MPITFKVRRSFWDILIPHLPPPPSYLPRTYLPPPTYPHLPAPTHHPTYLSTPLPHLRIYIPPPTSTYLHPHPPNPTYLHPSPPTPNTYPDSWSQKLCQFFFSKMLYSFFGLPFRFVLVLMFHVLMFLLLMVHKFSFWYSDLCEIRWHIIIHDASSRFRYSTGCFLWKVYGRFSLEYFKLIFEFPRECFFDIVLDFEWFLLLSLRNNVCCSNKTD